MPRFTVVEHDYPSKHWDLFLENDDHCKSWRLLSLPSPNAVIRGELSAPHRLLYLYYEGPVSNNRGTVTRFDSGEYFVVSQSDNQLIAMIESPRFKGHLIISQDTTDCWVTFPNSSR